MKVLPGWFILIVASASAQTEAPVPTPFPCTAVDGIEPICGFARPPEDLEDLADGRVLVGEYGAMSGAKPGVLSLFDPQFFRGQTTISGVLLRFLNRIAVFGCALRSSGRLTAHSPV